MERIRWSEKPIPFRSLVDNSAIRKPALVQIGTKSIVVGEKINGQFLMASPCKVSNDRFDVMEQEIVLSSRHTGIWRVVSKTTSKKAGHIHRLSTKDIESIYKQDVENKRTTPRSYICTKKTEVFELHVRSNDPTIVSGVRIERRIIHMEENVEFLINEIGEVEYTPTEGERTSQDYVMVAKNKTHILVQLLVPGMQEKERLIRNRVLRSLYCTTKNEPHKRCFLLEVNEQPCDIRPIASEGSIELRYLHSTQNLFDYMLTYGNDTLLYVKLLRGDPPIKAIEFDGYMVLKSTLNGDQIPICRVEDLEVTLVDPDLPVRVKLPVCDQAWRSLSEIRAAEFQCMQLSLALLARHESEMYVTVEVGRNTANFLQSNTHQQQKRSSHSRQSSDTVIRPTQGPTKPVAKFQSHDDLRFEQRKKLSNDQQKIFNIQTPKLTRRTPLVHPASDELYRNEEKRLMQTTVKPHRHRLEKGEKSHQIQRKITSDRPTSSLAFSSNHHNKTQAKII